MSDIERHLRQVTANVRLAREVVPDLEYDDDERPEIERLRTDIAPILGMVETVFPLPKMWGGCATPLCNGWNAALRVLPDGGGIAWDIACPCGSSNGWEAFTGTVRDAQRLRDDHEEAIAELDEARSYLAIAIEVKRQVIAELDEARATITLLANALSDIVGDPRWRGAALPLKQHHVDQACEVLASLPQTEDTKCAQ